MKNEIKTQRYQVVFTYGDEDWFQNFELSEGEHLTDVIFDIRNEWLDEVASTIEDFDLNEYEMQTFKLI